MFDDPDNPLCPVKTFQLYLTKLNLACPSLFQRPHDGITKASRFWFHMFPLNNTMLALMMYDISKDAGLSRVYPNFCTQVRLAFPACVVLFFFVCHQSDHSELSLR